MEAADVNKIWECMKENDADDRNPYRKFLDAKKDGGLKKVLEIRNSNMEIRDSDKELQTTAKDVATSVLHLSVNMQGLMTSISDLLDEDSGEESSSRIQEL